VQVTAHSCFVLLYRYATTIENLVQDRGINVHLQRELVEVRGRSREAVFNVMGPGCTPTGDQVVMSYDMLHVTPPQGECGE
jgi:sulfide:quinone oxidoreductase